MIEQIYVIIKVTAFIHFWIKQNNKMNYIKYLYCVKITNFFSILLQSTLHNRLNYKQSDEWIDFTMEYIFFVQWKIEFILYLKEVNINKLKYFLNNFNFWHFNSFWAICRQNNVVISFFINIDFFKIFNI